MADHRPLLEIMHEHLRSKELQLPVFQPVASKMQEMLGTREVNIHQVANTIAEDQALASQILRVANSEFFAGLRKVTTIKDAMVRLGSKHVLLLAKQTTEYHGYSAKNAIISVYIETLWKHALTCALSAAWFAEKLGYAHVAQEAYMAGLLHDIGKLFLLKVLDDIHSSDTYNIRLSKGLIVGIVDAMHAEQGYELLKQWNIPDIYCEVARDHHQENYDRSNNILVLVRLVNLGCRKVGVSMHHDPSIVLAATTEAQEGEIPEVPLAELEIMIEDALLAS